MFGRRSPAVRLVLALPLVTVLWGCPRSIQVANEDAGGSADAGTTRSSDLGRVPGEDMGTPDDVRDAGAPPMDAGFPVDAWVPPGPWIDAGACPSDPELLPPPTRSTPEGWEEWTAFELAYWLKDLQLDIDSNDRMHVATIDREQRVHARTGGPTDWTEEPLYDGTRSSFGDEMQRVEQTLVGDEPQLGYAHFDHVHAQWASRPCGATGWDVRDTPFIVSDDNAQQPSLAFDASTGHLWAVGVVEREGVEVAVGLVSLPSMTVEETPATVANWFGYGVRAVADAGYVHFLAETRLETRLHSRDPTGRWRSLEVGEGLASARLALAGDTAHVFIARRLDRSSDARELVHFRVDIRSWAVEESVLPFAPRFNYWVRDVAVSSDGQLHLALTQNNSSVEYATNASGAWARVELVPFEGAYRPHVPAVALDSAGRAWIAYSAPSEWEVRLLRAPVP